MNKKIYFILGGLLLLLFLSTGITFGEEQIIKGGVVMDAPLADPDIQWLWGEVLSTDALNRTLLIKYLDFETDQEKEIVINLDDKTTFENIKSLNEIKSKDTLSIDYILAQEGKNIAKNISLESAENSPIEKIENQAQTAQPALYPEQPASPTQASQVNP